MKKAQIFGVPLVYIFIAIVTALILIFGLRAIKDVSNLADKVQITKELEKLESDISTIFYASKGTSQEFTYIFPKITDVCFNAKEITGEDPGAAKSSTINRIPTKNIFLFSGNKILYTNKLNNIDSGNTKCIKISNTRLKLTFENQGNYVSIK